MRVTEACNLVRRKATGFLCLKIRLDLRDESGQSSSILSRYTQIILCPHLLFVQCTLIVFFDRVFLEHFSQYICFSVEGKSFHLMWTSFLCIVYCHREKLTCKWVDFASVIWTLYNSSLRIRLCCADISLLCNAIVLSFDYGRCGLSLSNTETLVVFL